MSIRITAACAAFLVTAAPAAAHHPDATAGGGSGPIATTGASTLEAGQAAFAFVNQLIKVRSFDFRTLGVNSEAHTMKYINSAAFAAAYGVTDDFTLAVRLPVVRRADVTDGHRHANPVPPPHVTLLGTSNGIGDVSVLGQYRFYNNRESGTEAALLFGFKAPTGDTGRMTSENQLFEAEFQPGSGSWDGLVGAALSQRFGAWSFHTNSLVTITGTGTQATNLGNRVNYNVAAVVRLMGEAPHAHAPGTPPHLHAATFALDGVIEINGEWQDFTTVAGVRDPNSGGNTIYISPGLRASYGNFGTFLSVGIPVVRDLNGLQAAPDYRVLLGASIALGH
jgi:hypothetical protein